MPLTESATAGQEFLASEKNDFAKYINRAFKAGIIEDFFGIEADVPTGFLLCDGLTIGDASSNATARANADMATLFAHLWNVGQSLGTLLIYTSAGGASTFGANAAADFAAHKRLALPFANGRTFVAPDDMGAADAALLTGVDTGKVGGLDGAETVSIAHTHDVTAAVGTATGSGRGAWSNTSTPITSSAMSANSTPKVVQPSMIVNKIICAGVIW